MFKFLDECYVLAAYFYLLMLQGQCTINFVLNKQNLWVNYLLYEVISFSICASTLCPFQCRHSFDHDLICLQLVWHLIFIYKPTQIIFNLLDLIHVIYNFEMDMSIIIFYSQVISGVSIRCFRVSFLVSIVFSLINQVPYHSINAIIR